jgi:hypothetical protein
MPVLRVAARCVALEVLRKCGVDPGANLAVAGEATPDNEDASSTE